MQVSAGHSVVPTGDSNAIDLPGEPEARRQSLAAGARMALLGNWRRFVPESLAICVLLMIVEALLGRAGHADITNTTVFWLPVLLMSAQYGLIGGLFATIAATVSTFLLVSPQQTVNQDFYSYASALLSQPAAWLTYALTIGSIRTRHMFQTAELERQIDDSSTAGDTLVGSLQSAIAEIERLELRIASDSSTLTTTVGALGQLDTKDSQHLISSFAQVIRACAGVATLTIYLRAGQTLKPVVRLDGSEVQSAPRLPDIPVALIHQLEAAQDGLKPARSPSLPGLPIGAIVMIPIGVGTDQQLQGAILIERLHWNQEPEEAALRTRMLAQTLANLLTGAKLGPAG